MSLMTHTTFESCIKHWGNGVIPPPSKVWWVFPFQMDLPLLPWRCTKVQKGPQPFGKFPNNCSQHDCGAYLTNMSYYAATIKSELVTRDIWELRWQLVPLLAGQPSIYSSHSSSHSTCLAKIGASMFRQGTIVVDGTSRKLYWWWLSPLSNDSWFPIVYCIQHISHFQVCCFHLWWALQQYQLLTWIGERRLRWAKLKSHSHLWGGVENIPKVQV